MTPKIMITTKIGRPGVPFRVMSRRGVEYEERVPEPVSGRMFGLVEETKTILQRARRRGEAIRVVMLGFRSALTQHST